MPFMLTFQHQGLYFGSQVSVRVGSLGVSPGWHGSFISIYKGKVSYKKPYFHLLLKKKNPI